MSKKEVKKKTVGKADKMKKLERIEKFEKAAKKMLTYIGLFYVLSVFSVISKYGLGVLGQLIMGSEMVKTITTVELIPVANFFLSPIIEMIHPFPYASFIVLSTLIMRFLISRLKSLSPLEVNTFTAFVALTFFT